MSIPALLTAALLAALATANAWLLRRRAHAALRAGLFAFACFSLWLSLFPPPVERQAQPLHVYGIGSGDRQVPADAIVLPEASVRGGDRQPDLGSALRRHPGHTRIVLHGHGLSERDLDALRDERLEFDPTPLPPGLHQLNAPRWLAPGELLQVRGRVDGIADARVELRAPDDSLLAQSALAADGSFTLSTALRGPGRNTLDLRLLRGDEPIDAVSIAVAQRFSPPLRLSILASASNPEWKYLRRWARDAGADLRTQLQLSPAVLIGERLALTPEALTDTELLLADERSWRRLDQADRQRVIAAVRAGLGLLLRLEQMPDARTRALLAELDLEVAPGAEATPPSLPGDELPSLDRLPLTLGGRAWQPLGGAAGLWQPLGRGRVGLWLLRDSHRLILAGQADAYGRLWQKALNVLARARAEAPPIVRPDDARVGARVTVCSTDTAELTDPQGHEIGLHWQQQADSTQTCAAFWPRLVGWHLLKTADGEWPIAIRASDEAAGLRLQRLHDATAARALADADDATETAIAVPGSPLPWALLWLVTLTLLWWLERRRV